MRSLKRMISVCVLLCMIISLIPLTTFANDASAQSVPGRVLLDPGMVCSTVWVDGVDYAVRSSGGQRYIDLPADADPGSLVIYEHHIGDPSDIHTQYPIGMQVWSLEKNDDGTFTPRQVEELTDILKYSGSSIRITGNNGIRMITSMDRSKKAALAGDGLAGYKLLEYGTVLAWSDELKDGDPLILGPEYAKHNYAYKRDEADPIFAYKNDLMQYTNVLVGFSLEECSDDIAMRPYMILEGPDGEQLTVYGGIVHRSIGYIAWQNRNDFTPGTAAYNYVWEIIRQVYAQITFQTNGGSQLEYMLVEKGMIPQLPSEPEKEGFTFGGWYTDEALRDAFDPTAPLTEDVTLYAKWVRSGSIPMPEDPSETDLFYWNNSVVLDVITASESEVVPSESEVVSLLASRGFDENRIIYDFTIDGTYIGSTDVRSNSQVKRPAYFTYYRTENGDLWIVYVINDAITAYSLTYNAQSSLSVDLMISESETITSYVDETNQYYITIPYETAMVVRVVDRIDAETLEQLTIDAIDAMG